MRKKGNVKEKTNDAFSLSTTEFKQIVDQVVGWTDGNRPQLGKSRNGFLDTLENGKSELSSSPAFVRKAVL